MFRKYPPVRHILIVGKPGRYKDVTAVKFCHEAVMNDRNVYSNLSLGMPHTLVKSVDEYVELRDEPMNPGMCYVHDIGTLFHSRDFKKKGTSVDARKHMVNNYRKRGLQIIGTLHRENEIDIEIRLIVDFFVYPKVYNVGDPENMEDDVVVLRWYDKPEMYDQGEKPRFKTYYDHPERYARLFDTLEESNLI